MPLTTCSCSSFIFLFFVSSISGWLFCLRVGATGEVGSYAGEYAGERRRDGGSGEYGTYAGEDGTYAGEDGTYAGEDGTYAGEDGTYAGEDGTYGGEAGGETREKHKSNKACSANHSFSDDEIYGYIQVQW